MGKRIAIAAAVIAAGALGGTWWLAGFVMTGHRQTLEEALTWQSERYDTSFYDDVEKVDYTVEGVEGYILHVEELVCPSPSERYVIISHGYTDNRMGALKYARFYLDLGYNCIIWDLRGHGKNKPTFTTYGLLEGQDLACLVREVRRRHPNLTQLGLQGESLGAATTLSSLRYAPEVDFVVSDCAFSNIMGVLYDGYRSAGAPSFLVDVANVGARLRFGYALSDMRPIDALRSADPQLPILFVHGADDDFIAPHNASDLAEVAPGPHEIWFVEGAGHAESALIDPDGYRQHLEDFLAQLV